MDYKHALRRTASDDQPSGKYRKEDQQLNTKVEVRNELSPSLRQAFPTIAGPHARWKYSSIANPGIQ